MTDEPGNTDDQILSSSTQFGALDEILRPKLVDGIEFLNGQADDHLKRSVRDRYFAPEFRRMALSRALRDALLE